MEEKSVLVIGAGTWGKKIVGTLSNDLGISHLSILQRNSRDHAGLTRQFPTATLISALDEIDRSVDLAIVATPAASQHEILSKLVDRKIPTLVEKPFCRTHAEAKELAERYRSGQIPLYVDNVYLYSDAFRRFAATFAREFEGKTFTYTSRRWDFGSFPGDTNTLSHLIYHDLAMLEEMVGLEALTPLAYRHGIEHYAQLTLQDAKGSIYDLTASQISAKKVRTVAVANSTRGLDWDDLDSASPLRLYGFDVPTKTTISLDPVEIVSSKHSPLGNVLAHALERSTRPDYESVDVALKIKAFIDEVEA